MLLKRRLKILYNTYDNIYDDIVYLCTCLKINYLDINKDLLPIYVSYKLLDYDGIIDYWINITKRIMLYNHEVCLVSKRFNHKNIEIPPIILM